MGATQLAVENGQVTLSSSLKIWEWAHQGVKYGVGHQTQCGNFAQCIEE